MAPEAVRSLAWAVSVLVQVEHKFVVREASCLRKTVHALVAFSEHTSVYNEFVKIISGTSFSVEYMDGDRCTFKYCLNSKCAFVCCCFYSLAFSYGHVISQHL